MGFLAPAFLAGLALLAVPVLVHLTHRPRSTTVPFPSLMFLQRIPYKSSRRRTLRNRLLFALRCAALALLAAAFARPFLGSRGTLAASAGQGRTRVILLDRSGSMAYGERWAKGVAAARRAIGELGAGDRASLVFFGAGTETTGAPSLDRGPMLASLDAARAGFGATRYAPALQAAAEMLEASPLPVRDVVLITDFQKTGWEGGDDVRLPAGTTLLPVDVSERGGASNVAITGVDLGRDYEAGRERVVVAARLVNKGARPAEAVELALEVDGRAVRQQRASLAPNTAATVTFDAFPLPADEARAAVRIAPSGLPGDDAFHFLLAPGGDVRVLVLEAPGAPERRGLYLRRALSIGHRPRFRVETRTAAQLSPADLATARVLVLNDIAPAAARPVREFVERGGGLIVVLGEQAAAGAWRGEAEGLLPGPFGPAADRSADWGGTLAHLDYAHPVFELFRGPRSGDFSSARFFRYRTLAAADGVLARFDDGAVALAEKKVGKGRVLVWTSTLDTFWGDLALQPVFLPFVHQLVRHAAGHVDSRPWHTVGEALDLSAEAELRGREVAVLAPQGEKLRLPAGQRALELTAPGYYEVRRLEGGGRWSRVAAVNVDASESDLAHLDAEELVAAVTRGDGPAGAGRGAAVPTREEHESRQALWRWLLLAACAVLALETVLSNRPGLTAGAATR
jgi:aerotolerance regulator-like protein/VWA domain-containing protein